jgi:hypothetical protein
MGKKAASIEAGPGVRPLQRLGGRGRTWAATERAVSRSWPTPSRARLREADGMREDGKEGWRLR